MRDFAAGCLARFNFYRRDAFSELSGKAVEIVNGKFRGMPIS
ncbi:MAG TPA: hypothetical protein VNX70_10900 [Bryobacteraceae bacterium]|nr:hypothetical protein [Bryobacteraceae bacterium]